MNPYVKLGLYTLSILSALIIIALLLVGLLLVFSCDAHAEDITMKDTLGLYYPTHINEVMAAWDTMVADIIHCGVYVERVGMVGSGGGEWHGIYVPTFTGNFVVAYKGVYAGDTTAGEPHRFTVLDTVAFHGAAAGLSASEIADTLFNRGYVPGSGTGANQVTIRTKSSTDSAAIPGASVAVWNADQTALLRLLGTDTDSGKAVFALDNGTYNLRIQAYKFQWPVPIIIGVSGNKDTTVYATEFTPTPPPSVDFCTVYGYMDSVGLQGRRGKISCTIYAENLRVGTKVLSYGAYSKTVYTNASGYWEMFLYPNAKITPAGTIYEFEITVPTQPQPAGKRKVEVPELPTWEYTW